ncbi:hypothetical protein [Luteimonas sp. R10]|uniref:hypothetical protein n=1 Tax=Luteimonas sp. R10 TaxID=3108176 RepID=UPI00308F3E81|nr:hypothetical protein U3649_05875 [Luteimonas sp. R10]
MSWNKPLVVAAVLALLVGAALYQRAGERPGPVPAMDDAGDFGNTAALVTSTGAVPAPAKEAAAAHALPGADDRRRQLRRGFERAPDLYAYLQSLLPAARAGEADAIWLVSRVYEYCAPYAGDPAAYADDTRLFGEMKLRASEAMTAARERVSRRCMRFAPEDGLDYRTILLRRTQAAEAGSLAAEASLLAMGEPLDDSKAYRRDLADRVQRSADPEAFIALAPAMGVMAAGDDAHAGQVAGSQLTELAWQLAGCELGQDCSAEGPLMTNYCANGGICSQDEEQDFQTFVYDAAIPRQGAEVVDDMIDSLLRSEGVPR